MIKEQKLSNFRKQIFNALLDLEFCLYNETSDLETLKIIKQVETLSNGLSSYAREQIKKYQKCDATDP